MATRAVLKKISPCYTRFLGGRQLIPPCSGRGSSRWGDRSYLQNNKEVISRAGEIENWGKSKQESLYKKEKIEEEQQSYLEEGSEWLALNNFLYHQGFQTRQLLCMKYNHGTVSEEVRKGGTVQFTTPSFNMESQSSKLLVLDNGSRQTVNGLVCISAWDKEEFLIYNPRTGEKSPWIKTTTTSEVRKEGESRRKVDSIAFGFDHTRNEHKVICVSSVLKKTSGITAAQQDARAIVVEVLTIDRNTWTSGESIWRRLPKGETPIAGYKSKPRLQFLDPPVYVNGSIYWLFCRPEGHGVLAEFLVQSEVFVYCSIPFKWKNGAPLPTFQLMEIDGHVGVLKRISDYEACVYILLKLGRLQFDSDDDEHEDDADNLAERIKWVEENISLPCAWTAGTHLSIEALTGTNIIFIQPESSDSVFCYNRNTKASERFRIFHDRERIMQL